MKNEWPMATIGLQLELHQEIFKGKQPSSPVLIQVLS